MELTRWRRHGRFSWRIELTWQDMWCGLFVQRPKLVGGIDFYLCLVPMVPVHIRWNRTIEVREYGPYEYTYHYLDKDGNEIVWGHGDDEAVDSARSKGDRLWPITSTSVGPVRRTDDSTGISVSSVEGRSND